MLTLDSNTGRRTDGPEAKADAKSQGTARGTVRYSVDAEDGGRRTEKGLEKAQPEVPRRRLKRREQEQRGETAGFAGTASNGGSGDFFIQSHFPTLRAPPARAGVRRLPSPFRPPTPLNFT